MKTEIFEQLKKTVKRDSSDTDIQQIAFISKVSNYELSFYGMEENNHELVIEHCGFANGNKWFEIELLENQEKELQEIINDEIEVIEQNIKEEERENNCDEFHYHRDSYESTGTKQSDFY